MAASVSKIRIYHCLIGIALRQILFAAEDIEWQEEQQLILKKLVQAVLLYLDYWDGVTGLAARGNVGIPQSRNC